MSSHLNDENSLYLKEYSKTLVKWYPWGEEALKKAKNEKKAIFLSIGYSTSQWCKMMLEESFENETIAELINDNFIAIKVDKNERTDIDKYYKNVYRLMNGQGCDSPISIFLTEDLEPFYTATYIAPYPKGNVLGFEELLNVVIDKYTNDKETMIQKGKEVIEYLNPNNTKIEATRLHKTIINTIKLHTKELIDKENGGFGEYTKFPHTSTLELLLETYILTNDRELLSYISSTLTKMADGEIHDRENGGFYRYSSQKDWSQPRLEKMTYDNALISSIYLDVYNVTKDNFYKKTAFKTIDFMLEKMSKDSLFFANSLTEKDGSIFIDTKIITSWNAMMINTLFKASKIDDKYREYAVDGIETLLEKLYINGELYHTLDVKAFLEDYAYLGETLLSAYNITKNQEYLIIAQTLINKAIEKFYQYGRWRFSDNQFTHLYDDIHDTNYPSAMATMIELIYHIEPLIEGEYDNFLFKTLEFNSYNIMRQPLSSPKISKVVLLYLKNDIIPSK